MDIRILEKANNYIEQETEKRFSDQIKALIDEKNEKELSERFYKNLAFGTAGLRGIIGGGTNRMNPYVVKKAAQGMANYLIKALPKEAEAGELKAVIAYDSRHYSPQFAESSALIFAANGITCFLFSSLRPTPELSFAIRELGCHTGVVVTASHNPPEYNGYKAYWSDGAQITPPHDTGIIDEVNKTEVVKSISRSDAIQSGKLKIIDSEIDEKYWSIVKAKINRHELIEKMSNDVEIVYTPLHGTGAMHVEKILGDMGFKILTVPEQREPDGNFPTVSYPNPEDPKALKMGFELAEKTHADILMATDPDADRFACAVRNADNEMQIISGNQMGALLTDYICLTAKEFGKMPAAPAIVRSIVTSSLSDSIAKSYGVQTFECLTGFKWICGLAEKMTVSGSNTYLYGFEESFGYNIGTEVRDKDGIATAAICAEMALYWKSKNKSLFDRLNELFVEHGLYIEKTINKVFKGAEGAKIMQAMMKLLRENTPAEIAEIPIKKIRDVLLGIEYSPSNKNATTKIDLPESNVLQYYLEDGTVLSVRPSGTEPKIKTYIIHRRPCKENSIEDEKQKGDEVIKSIEIAIEKILSE
ncbi:MAG: phosphomannomutase [Treponema sp.]|nr:MAG: phosphomannomutase [Treponema sp.]